MILFQIFQISISVLIIILCIVTITVFKIYLVYTIMVLSITSFIINIILLKDKQVEKPIIEDINENVQVKDIKYITYNTFHSYSPLSRSLEESITMDKDPFDF